MRFPSGVHPTAISGAGCQVRRFGSPPSAGMTNTSTLPSYWPVNAIHFPSGENTGNPSCPPVVNCRASPPSRGTLHKYPPYAKTIWVLLTVGACASNGVSSAAPETVAKASKMPIRIAIRKRMLPPGKRFNNVLRMTQEASEMFALFLSLRQQCEDTHRPTPSALELNARHDRQRSRFRHFASIGQVLNSI